MKPKLKVYESNLMNRLIISFVLLCSQMHQGFTQSSVPPLTNNPYRFNKSYVKSYWFDTRAIIKAPLHWNKNQWLAFGGLTLVAAGVYFKDEQIQNTFQINRSHAGDQITRYLIEPWGSGLYSAALLAVLYTDGLLSMNARLKKTALLGTKTLIITAAYSRIPKYVFQRHRPFQDTPPQPMAWEGPLHGFSHFTSFPSGHAVSAFALATVIASEYSDHWAIPILAFTLAGTVSLSRMYDNKHWASDVLVGAAFGYAMGKLIFNKDHWFHGIKKKKIIKNDN